MISSISDIYSMPFLLTPSYFKNKSLPFFNNNSWLYDNYLLLLKLISFSFKYVNLKIIIKTILFYLNEQQSFFW